MLCFVEVGGLLEIDTTWMRGMGATSSKDVDTLIQPGIYALDSNIQQINDIGLIIVFSAGGNTGYDGQLILGRSGLYSRIKIGLGDFSGIEWIGG